MKFKNLIIKGLDEIFLTLNELPNIFNIFENLVKYIPIFNKKLNDFKVRERFLAPKKRHTHKFKNKPKILFDLTHNMSWGDKCTALPYIAWIIEQRKDGEYSLITANWHNPVRSYKKRKYLYDPNKEPVDFFKNLVVPSLGLKNYYDLNSKVGNPKTNTQKYNIIFTGGEFNPLRFIWFRKVIQFEYKLAKDQINVNYLKLKKILSTTKNIVLYATWDDEMKFEHQHHKGHDGIPSYRLRGLGLSEEKFDKMVNLVKKIDEYCLKNTNCRIVLFSKKAQGWSKILKSNFFDFRMFEKNNLNFSQAFHLLVDNCVASIGQTCSMQLWINLEKRMKHITYIDSIMSVWVEDKIKNGWPEDKEGSIIFGVNHFSLDGYDGDIKKIFE